MVIVIEAEDYSEMLRIRSEYRAYKFLVGLQKRHPEAQEFVRREMAKLFEEDDEGEDFDSAVAKGVEGYR
jgi:16S rRNA C1402 (ribose-2'-O) methylase RsmI